MIASALIASALIGIAQPGNNDRRLLGVWIQPR